MNDAKLVRVSKGLFAFRLWDLFYSGDGDISEPGCTRTLNYYSFYKKNDKHETPLAYFIDLPGCIA
jgi:hypothetical protein